MPRGQSMPALYDEIHDHIKKANPSWSDSRIWATTVRAVAKGCLTGDTNFPGKQNMNAVSRARYCAAYAQWKRTHPKGTGLGKVPGKG